MSALSGYRMAAHIALRLWTLVRFQLYNKKQIVPEEDYI
jgi:hypothetical protein